MDVVDFAWQVIELHEENVRLKAKLEHYKKLCDLHAHTEEITGILLSAVIDPDSIINRGHRAVIEEQALGQGE